MGNDKSNKHQKRALDENPGSRRNRDRPRTICLDGDVRKFGVRGWRKEGEDKDA